MDIIGWVLVIALFIVGMAGAVFPILPGVLAVYGAFFVYGFFFGFEQLNVWFWVIQTFITVVIFVADYAVGAWGVNRYGGSRASVIGSTIGIIIGPFVIPVVGLVAGPFLGAVLGELTVSRDTQHLMKVGWGSVVGLLSGIVVKTVLQVFMIVLFVFWIWF
ncbi:DUF456 domain-containing protein [Paenibacillus turpanensis]|uniref:DUF456 domain-containing protein n=1 Tax=Paenibacillus turpanensis TaxID=2689078 RepID=UPI00140A55B2|nr:DUF456 family protein [Paenibacillus turpanensis]